MTDGENKQEIAETISATIDAGTLLTLDADFRWLEVANLTAMNEVLGAMIDRHKAAIPPDVLANWKEAKAFYQERIIERCRELTAAEMAAKELYEESSAKLRMLGVTADTADIQDLGEQ